MDKGHSVKALLIYPEFPGCPLNYEFCDLTLLYGELGSEEPDWENLSNAGFARQGGRNEKKYFQSVRTGCHSCGIYYARCVHGCASRAPVFWRSPGAASSGDCCFRRRTILLSQRLLLLLPKRPLVLLKRKERTLGRPAKETLPKRDQVQGQGR